METGRDVGHHQHAIAPWPDARVSMFLGMLPVRRRELTVRGATSTNIATECGIEPGAEASHLRKTSSHPFESTETENRWHDARASHLNRRSGTHASSTSTMASTVAEGTSVEPSPGCHPARTMASSCLHRHSQRCRGQGRRRRRHGHGVRAAAKGTHRNEQTRGHRRIPGLPMCNEKPLPAEHRRDRRLDDASLEHLTMRSLLGDIVGAVHEQRAQGASCRRGALDRD